MGVKKEPNLWISSTSCLKKKMGVGMCGRGGEGREKECPPPPFPSLSKKKHVLLWSVDFVVGKVNRSTFYDFHECHSCLPLHRSKIALSLLNLERWLGWLGKRLSCFDNANTLTMIIWVQLCHTQCMLVDKVLGKERAITIKNIISQS